MMAFINACRMLAQSPRAAPGQALALVGWPVDEFVFRFNRHKSRHAAFDTLPGIAAHHEPAPYNMLRAVGLAG
jgi:hypothetical protein